MIKYFKYGLLVSTLSIVGYGLLAECHNSSLIEFRGELIKSEDGKKVYLKIESEETKFVELKFVFDDSADLVVEDLGYVLVKGQYSTIFNAITVEEIEPVCMFVFLSKCTQGFYC